MTPSGLIDELIMVGTRPAANGWDSGAMRRCGAPYCQLRTGREATTTALPFDLIAI